MVLKTSDFRSIAFDDDLQRFVNRSDYHSDDSKKLAKVWARSDAVTRALKSKVVGQEHRSVLLNAVVRQLNTAWYYLMLKRQHLLPSKTSDGDEQLDFYTLVFPGETRDNTGIKDLNDKILGYQLNNEYREQYQADIQRIFRDLEFHVLGQNYKTAYFARSSQESRKEFDQGLIELDAAMRKKLLELLERKDELKDQELARKLRSKLKSERNYRFEMFYGMTRLANPTGPATDDANGNFAEVLKPIVYATPYVSTDESLAERTHLEITELMFQAVTETLKAAGIARILYNINRYTEKLIPKIPVDKDHDRRGQMFNANIYHKIARIARVIKKEVEETGFPDYSNIYINTVYTKTFLKKECPNPDVIRDIRKKKFQGPPLGQQIGLDPNRQRSWLELWLAGLNTLDFIKDFHSAREYPEMVRDYHELAVEAILDLSVDEPTLDINRVRDVINKDLRQSEEMAIFGTGSEHLFYSRVSDFPRRIFFSMDIRDFGVDVLVKYDEVNEKVVTENLKGRELLRETLLSTDWVTGARRKTYELTRETFHEYHRKTSGRKRFDQDVQLMLGGDELFVATHPKFTPFIHEIVRDLDKLELNVRCAIVHSLARSATGSKQRKHNQLAHQSALQAADISVEILKRFERQESRIRRLIGRINLDDDDEHSGDEKKFFDELQKLQLVKMYVEYVMPSIRRSSHHLDQLLQSLKQRIENESPVEEVKLFTFDGKEVKQGEVQAKADDLEHRVREKVGLNNIILI